MESYRMVLPEHLNHFGKLMGGKLLHWVDEAAWCAARLDFPSVNFVTVGMDQVAFHHGVDPGSVLRFSATQVKHGTTSVNYAVTVERADHPGSEAVFTTTVSLVCVNAQGEKRALPDGLA